MSKITVTIQIEGTTEYEKFKSPTSNREIDHVHVNRLIRAIKRRNLLQLRPIIVNTKWEIIDGQHRLEAARRLKIPIFYIMSDEITKSDMAILNSFQKNWKVMDYINYYTIEKHRGFDVLSRHISMYPDFTTSSVIQLLHPQHSRSKGLRDGDIDVSNAGKAATIFENIKEISKWLGREAYMPNFIYAVRRAIEMDNYKHDRVVQVLQHPTEQLSILPHGTKKEYLTLFAKIAA